MTTTSVRRRINAVVPTKRPTAAIHLVQSTRFARRLAKTLLLFLIASILAMMFLPWQQTSRGNGQVVAYAPQERQQTIQSRTKGIVIEIAPGLVEGTVVKKGEFLLEIQPYAANKAGQLENQLTELKTKEETAKAKAVAYQDNIDGFTDSGEFAVSAATEMVAAAEAKLKSKRNQVAAYEAKELQASLNYERQQQLLQQEIRSPKEIEKLKKEWDVAQANVQSVLEDVEASNRELKAKQDKLEETRIIAQTKITYYVALKQDALGSVATIRKEIAEVKIKLEELKQLRIYAPRDGTVFRLNVNELGDAVKEGDPLLTLVPDTKQKAVELFINGNDMPLVEVGQEVRLQFEGWPAVQFAGWPSIAVGTFSGTVATVDATDNGKGEFRLLITPNESEQKWPSDRFLRQGVRANGWVMLKRVKLGYEIWRQLNGFPVIVSELEPKKEKSKVPKLPK